MYRGSFSCPAGNNISNTNYFCSLKEESVKIVSGNGQYIIKAIDETIATGVIENQSVKVSAKKQGNTQIIVSDIKNNTSQTIEIKVFDKLTLEKLELSINPNRKIHINISAGSGQYSVISENENITKAQIEDTKVVITAIDNGTSKVIVTDTQTNEKQEIVVIVQTDIVIDENGILTKYTAEIPINGELILKDIKGIGKEVFKNKQTITHLVLENIETIGESAFASCQAIETISITNVKTIEKLAFSFNAELKSITIINTTDTELVINTQAFANCPNLEYVTLPIGTKELKSNVFSFCRELKTIISNSIDAPKIVRNTFPSTLKTNGKLIVPKNSKDKYTSWESSFATIEEQ